MDVHEIGLSPFLLTKHPAHVTLLRVFLRHPLNQSISPTKRRWRHWECLSRRRSWYLLHLTIHARHTCFAPSYCSTSHVHGVLYRLYRLYGLYRVYRLYTLECIDSTLYTCLHSLHMYRLYTLYMLRSSTLNDVLTHVLSYSLGPRCALPCRLPWLIVYPSLVLVL